MYTILWKKDKAPLVKWSGSERKVLIQIAPGKNTTQKWLKFLSYCYERLFVRILSSYLATLLNIDETAAYSHLWVSKFDTRSM